MNTTGNKYHLKARIQPFKPNSLKKKNIIYIIRLNLQTQYTKESLYNRLHSSPFIRVPSTPKEPNTLVSHRVYIVSRMKPSSQDLVSEELSDTVVDYGSNTHTALFIIISNSTRKTNGYIKMQKK